MVPEISAAQEQSMLENSKEEESKSNNKVAQFYGKSQKESETEESGLFKKRDSLAMHARSKADTPTILLDNSSAMILAGATTRGETKLNLEHNMQ